MPLTSELGLTVARKFQESDSLRKLLDEREAEAIRNLKVPLGDVEVWFSSLAVDQPFLTESMNLRRRSLFVELAGQIAREIEQRQRAASSDELPDWLGGLLRLWHRCWSSVVTLNYDTLIESAVRSLGIPGSDGRTVGVNDLLGSFPPEPPQFGRYAEEARDSFSLHKLHGSANWYGRPTGSDVFSIVRFDSLAPGWGEEAPPLSRALDALRDSLDPVILPPLADKSTLYRNATMSAIWRQANLSLAAASRVVIFGYSIPQTDTSMLALLADAVSPSTEIYVIDPNAEKVAERLEPLGLAATKTFEPPGTDCTSSWSDFLDEF